MSHSVPTASTCATYLMSEPRRRTFTCDSHAGVPSAPDSLTATHMRAAHLLPVSGLPTLSRFCLWSCMQGAAAQGRASERQQQEL